MLSKLTPLQKTAVVLLVLFTAFITWRAKRLETAFLLRNPSSALMHKPAPDFTLESNDGRTISLADYRGKKKVVLSYWASWCGPCRLELPQLRDFYQQYHKDDSDFEILAVSMDDDKSAADRYASEAKLPFPVLYDPRGIAADAYSVDAIPTIFVIGKDGSVKYANTGLSEELEFQLAMNLGIKIVAPGMPSGAAKNHDTGN
jgi:peroxiredoxin